GGDRARLALVFVAFAAADALVTAGAEGPAAVLRRRPVAGQDHAPDVAPLPRVIERAIELVDRMRPKRVSHLGAMERDPHRALIDGAVVGDVGEVEALDALPARRIEDG